jgi:hypothetical protein
MKRPVAATATLLLLIAMAGPARSESTRGTAEDFDEFGDPLAAGDFDGDGRADLAVGVPFEHAGGEESAGVVNVIYSSAAGLSKSGNEVWYQNTPDVSGAAEAMDLFGGALVSGDFNGDDVDDLAVGARGEDVGEVANAGAVNIVYGSNAGLTAVDGQLLTQEELGAGDRFGTALAAGDFNGDGHDDLAVGAPSEEIGSVAGVGVVDVFDGSPDGLSETGESWQQGASLGDPAESGDNFGQVLTAGNLGSGSQDDLVVGVPFEEVSAGNSHGAVHVVYGSIEGLSSSGSQFWHQNVAGIADTAEPLDRFGWSLAVANFGLDPQADLVVGVPAETLELDASEFSQAGAVHVLYGTSEAGVTEDNDQLWHQRKPGVRDRIEKDDRFGEALTVGDLGNSSRADLAIGVMGESLEAEAPITSGAGAMNILFGSAEGLTSAKDELWHQDVEGVRDAAANFERFGKALASGNFGSGPRADLAAGVPQEDFGEIDQAGAASILYGSDGGLTPAGDQFWHQSVP